MEYASEVWSPHYRRNIENLQRFAMRVCLGQWDLKQGELLSASGLTSLETRRVRSCKNVSLVQNFIRHDRLSQPTG